MKRCLQMVVFSALFVVAASWDNPVRAYEVKEVSNGGTITGFVKLKGEPESVAKLEITKDHSACGTSIEDESFLVKDGRIKNVVVSIEAIAEGKEPTGEQPVLNNVECRFVPHVLTMQVGTKLVIENGDPILHNTHGFYEDGSTAFNIALPLQDQKIRKRIKKAGTISMKCDAGHTWMSAYVAAFDHPYHAVTDEGGAFTLADVPPGTYTLVFWHERLPSKKVEVVVEAGKTASIEIEMWKKE